MHFEQSYYVSVIKRHFPESFVDTSVLEVGSYDVNGSIREFFTNCEYTGLDLMEGPGVDVVVSGHEYKTYKRFKTVLSCECFEHNPYFFETFENMVSLACGGGLVIFSCATEGRPEHGTSRTSPDQSPGTISSGWDYYLNLKEKDFSAFEFQKNFAGYRFMVNPGSQDLYFVGVKYPAPENFEERLDRIVEEVDQLTKASVQFVKSDKLFKEGDPSGAADSLEAVAPFVHPELEAYVRYRQAWHLMAAKRYPEADVVIKRLLSLGDRAEFHFQSSQFLHEAGRAEAAIAAARAAIAREQENADYWEHLANLLLNSADTAGAEIAFLEAGRLAPLDASRKERIKTLGFQQRSGEHLPQATKTTTYVISISAFKSPEFERIIRLWNLDSPVNGEMRLFSGDELTLAGWVLTQDEMSEVSLIVQVGHATKKYDLNVDRPDVVSSILRKSPEVSRQVKCGFSYTVPANECVMRLGFRVAGVDCWGCEVRVSKQPPLLVGKDQWVFAAETGNGILELNGQPASFERQDAMAWNKRIAGENTKLKKPHLVLVAPHKAAVYPDLLPADAALAFNRPVYEILGRNFTVAYPLERLLTARVRRPTYARTGAVWTSYGAYVAYRALMDRLGHAGWSKKLVEESAVVWGADGAVKSFERKAQLSFQNGLIGPGQIKHYKNSAGAGLLPRVVAFCDEFGMTDFASFLAESCSELLCIHMTELDAELVERFAPDVVLSQYSEETLARAPAEAGSLFGMIKTGFNSGIYPAAQLEQLVSSGRLLNDILGEKDASVLLQEAQNILR